MDTKRPLRTEVLQNDRDDKHQAPNPKLQTSTKPQAPSTKRLEFGIWNLVLAWNLGFGIWDLQKSSLYRKCTRLRLP